MTDEQLSALLRIKRYEQPPPGYFDQLLRDVHRRQRAELLQRPLWKIALERMQTFFGEHSMGTASFAGAMAAVLIVGFAAINVFAPSPRQAQPQMAATSTPAETRSVQLASNHAQQPATIVEPQPFRPSPPAQTASLQPRYIIDARPVSYERRFDF